MMEIVIKIPKELYEAYKGRPPMLGDAGMDMIAKSIANGTPLPEHHGRIIDEDKIGEFRIGSMCKFMTNAPTIIEGSDPE